MALRDTRQIVEHHVVVFVRHVVCLVGERKLERKSRKGNRAHLARAAEQLLDVHHANAHALAGRDGRRPPEGGVEGVNGIGVDSDSTDSALRNARFGFEGRSRLSFREKG